MGDYMRQYSNTRKYEFYAQNPFACFVVCNNKQLLPPCNRIKGFGYVMGRRVFSV